jgi:hypothetical protein
VFWHSFYHRSAWFGVGLTWFGGWRILWKHVLSHMDLSGLAMDLLGAWLVRLGWAVCAFYVIAVLSYESAWLGLALIWSW